jgi:Flp pilus assembly protein TadB
MTKKEITLGNLYSGITSTKQEEVEEQKLKKEVDPKYVRFCKWCYKKAPSLGSPDTLKPKVKDAIGFLDWRIKPKEYNAGVKFVTILGIIGAIFLILLIYLTTWILSNYVSGIVAYQNLILLLAVFIGLVSAAFTIYSFMKHPLKRADTEKRFALAYLPEMIGYLTMSLKLVPNLENAVHFAATQGKGKLAEEFKTIMWDLQLGRYNTIEEGIDKLVLRWKPYSSELKEAMMAIKSAMVEDNDARRSEILDKTVENVLDSIKIKMEGYARKLSQPSLVLFYMGILMPLLLVIILPIGSVFADLPFSNPWALILIYNVGLPLFVLIYSRSIIRKMPTLYTPPEIPENYKGLPKKNNLKIGRLQLNLYLVTGIILIIGIIGSAFLQFEFGSTLEKIMIDEQFEDKYVENPNLYFETLATESLAAQGKAISEKNIQEEMSAQKMLFLMQPGHDTTPFFIIYGLALTFALCLFIYFYFSSIYKKRIQNKYILMEDEFKEVLYIIASRLSEGKPMEDAIKSTSEFFPDLTITQDTLAKALDNLNLLGMPMEQAFFDSTFGALKNNPSMLMKNNFRIIIDSLRLGVATAAKTTFTLGLQLKNVDSIRNLVKKVTVEITQMMNTMATMIAPAVLGITTSMQKIIILTLNSLASSGFSSSSAQTAGQVEGSFSSFNPASMMSSFDTTSIGSIATPTAFNIIIIIYVVLLVIILSYFTSRLVEENPLATRQLIAITTPISIVIFIIASLLAGMLLTGGI